MVREPENPDGSEWFCRECGQRLYVVPLAEGLTEDGDRAKRFGPGVLRAWVKRLTVDYGYNATQISRIVGRPKDGIIKIMRDLQG